MSDVISIEPNRFNDNSHIVFRAAAAPDADRGSLRTALRFLYLDDGPVNLPRDRLLLAKRYLDTAELVVIAWLYTRTNGRLRNAYGADALRAARASRYRCEICGFADVRALNLDHVSGRVADTAFACLCANCHTIKSRRDDWTGVKAPPQGRKSTVLLEQT